MKEILWRGARGIKVKGHKFQEKTNVQVCCLLFYCNARELSGAIVGMWVNLVANWNTWEEEEDEVVFESIEEVEPTSNITPKLRNPPEIIFLEIQLLPMSSPENI
jgi:hypothetical protein